MSEQSVAVQFDHFDHDLAQDPLGTHELYRHLRETCPVAHTDRNGGHWVVSRYEDIHTVLYDPGTFTSVRATTIPPHGQGDIAIPLIESSPAEHTPLRRVLQTWFTPGKAREYEGRTREIARAAAQEIATKDRCDLASEYARVVPAKFFATLMGVAPSDLAWVAQLVDTFTESASDDAESGAAAFSELASYFAKTLADRAAAPANDLPSFLASLTVKGQPLSFQEQVSLCVLFQAAGTDTTFSSIGNALWYLAQEPKVLERLAANPTHLEAATEEFLRYFAPVTMGRQATCDTELNGQKIRAGDRLLLVFPSANRDTEAFTGADVVDLERTHNRHLTFGSGIHRCLGMHLARMELRVALEEFLALVPRFRLDPEGTVRWSVGQVRGIRSLPVIIG